MPSVEAVVAGPNDSLIVRGTTEKGEIVHAFGWQSAMQNHYDPSNYGEDGHRVPGSEPREMSSQEKLDYCRRLLVEQNPTTGSITDLNISG